MIAIFLLPVYPTFASFVNQTSSTEFDRGEIDESSIISSYFGDTETVGDGSVFIQSKDSYLHVNAAMIDGDNTISASKEIVDYEVLGGESIASIAAKFNVSEDSVLWANNFVKNQIIHPGDIIKVPPVSGLIHKVQSGDTLSGLAAKYKVSSEDIMRQNLLLKAEDLKIGASIVIPGAKKEIPKPKPPVRKTYASSKSSSRTASQPNVAQSASEYVNSQ